jgi:uncharacterized protein with PQ loop repeat
MWSLGAGVDDMVEQIVIGAYATVNWLRVLTYLPQIAKVARAQDRAEAISVVTWTLWTVCNVTTSIYGALIVRDLSLTAIFASNAVCCAVVVTIVLWKRKRHDERTLFMAANGAPWNRETRREREASCGHPSQSHHAVGRGDLRLERIVPRRRPRSLHHTRRRTARWRD